MNIALWVVQGLLAFAFFMAGLMKMTKSKEELAVKMGWVEDLPIESIRKIGAVEVLGAIGLILPMITGIATFLTPLAAFGLAMTMFVAAGFHLRKNEPLVPNFVFALLAVFITVGRFDLF